MRAQLSTQIIYALCCLQAEKETLRGRGKQEHEWGWELNCCWEGGAGDFSVAPAPSPTSYSRSRLIQRRAGSPVPTLLHCSSKALRNTVGMNVREAIPILSLSFSTWNLPSHSFYAAKPNWRACSFLRGVKGTARGDGLETQSPPPSSLWLLHSPSSF